MVLTLNISFQGIYSFPSLQPRPCLPVLVLLLQPVEMVFYLFFFCAPDIPIIFVQYTKEKQCKCSIVGQNIKPILLST